MIAFVGFLLFGCFKDKLNITCLSVDSTVLSPHVDDGISAYDHLMDIPENVMTNERTSLTRINDLTFT